MAQSGLRKWVAEKWVDIGAPKKDGKYQPCGRSKGSKRKYPKCVPLAKARSMSESQKNPPSEENAQPETPGQSQPTSKHLQKANQKDKTRLCREHPTNSRLKPKSISGPRRVVRG
jgi:hypothetical protein